MTTTQNDIVFFRFAGDDDLYITIEWAGIHPLEAIVSDIELSQFTERDGPPVLGIKAADAAQWHDNVAARNTGRTAQSHGALAATLRQKIAEFDRAKATTKPGEPVHLLDTATSPD